MGRPYTGACALIAEQYEPPGAIIRAVSAIVADRLTAAASLGALALHNPTGGGGYDDDGDDVGGCPTGLEPVTSGSTDQRSAD
jgi:hypothetical protein